MRKQFNFVVVDACALLASGVCAMGANPSPDEVLASKGLTKNGATWLLETDVNLGSVMRGIRETKSKVDDSNRQRASLVHSIRGADMKLDPIYAKFLDVKAKIEKARDPANHNQYVDTYNSLREKLLQILKSQDDDKAKLSRLPDYSDDYMAALGKASLKLEAAASAYDRLADDEAVKAALDALTKKGPVPALLGPSATFKRELYAVRKEARVLKPDVIKFEANRSVAIINVTMNGNVTCPMIVDSGATWVSLSTEIAGKLGIVPGPNDRTVKTKIANGDVVDATVVTVKSIRVGNYTVENVKCLIQPKMAAGADCLLGVSFLENFIYRMDLTAGELHLKPAPDAKVKIGDDDPAAAPKPVAARPQASATPGTPGKKIDLLALIDPKKDAVGGVWTVNDKTLSSDMSNGAKIRIPYEAPEEYDFTIEFTRASGPDAILQYGTTGTESLQMVFGGNGNHAFGFLVLNDQFLTKKNPSFVEQKSCLTNGQKYLSVMKVRRDGVQMFLDGKLLCGFRRNSTKIGCDAAWALPKATDIGLGSNGSSTRFTRIELTEISGAGKPLRAKP